MVCSMLNSCFVITSFFARYVLVFILLVLLGCSDIYAYTVSGTFYSTGCASWSYSPSSVEFVPPVQYNTNFQAYSFSNIRTMLKKYSEYKPSPRSSARNDSGIISVTTGVNRAFSFCGVSNGSYYCFTRELSSNYFGSNKEVYVNNADVSFDYKITELMQFTVPSEGEVIKTSQPRIEWVAVPEAAAYELRFQSNAVPDWAVSVSIVFNTTNNYYDVRDSAIHLPNSTNCRVSVKAYDTHGNVIGSSPADERYFSIHVEPAHASGRVVACGGEAVEGAVVKFCSSSREPYLVELGSMGDYSIDIPPDDYAVKVDAPEYASMWYSNANISTSAVVLSLASSSVTENVNFELNRGQNPALVGVDSSSTGVTVYVDYLPTASVTPCIVDIGQVASHVHAASHGGVCAFASHSVTLYKQGFPRPSVQIVNVEQAEVARMAFDMGATNALGSLYVTSDPVGADVYVDYADKLVGKTPLTLGQLLPGSHTVLLHKQGMMQPRPVMAHVVSDETVSINIPMVATNSKTGLKVNVTSVPEGTSVYVDYLDAEQVTDMYIDWLDPASHAGRGWRSVSHTILLRKSGMLNPLPAYVSDSATSSVQQLIIPLLSDTPVDAYVQITNVAETVDSRSISIGGESYDLVGDIIWSNNATGLSGRIAAQAQWRSSLIDLEVGANVITVASQNGEGQNVYDYVVVTRQEALGPVMTINPTSVVFRLNSDGLATNSFSVSNSGSGVLTYTVNDSMAANWLVSCTPGTTLNDGQQQVHSVVVNTSGLRVGSYATTLTVDGNGTPNTQNVTVQLILTASHESLNPSLMLLLLNE